MKKILKNLPKFTLPALLPSTDPTTWKLCKPGETGCTDIINVVIGNATNFAFSLAGGIAVILLIYAGFTYVTAYGNEARATQAKNIMLYSIIGLVIIILARLFYNELIRFLR